MNQLRSILATDCGSTTTKCILIELTDQGYRLSARGEAPTTVEAPFDDVTIGVLNAVREVEELTSRHFIENDTIITPQNANGDGVDAYLSTSSAGGGLQMTVSGVVKQMSAESAQRAALGAGAIIMDVIAVDDGRKEYQKVQRIRQLRPDMILMSGGTDGGTVNHLVEMAEILLSADPKPRLGGMDLPVIYAGNTQAREAVGQLLDKKVDLRFVDNLRPTMDEENLGPAREAIHELFLEHVMRQAPGYGKLMGWTSADIMSTPNAVGAIMQTIAQQESINILGVDIGGATTDVFSVFNGTYNRTVSANLGMSYSICNVMVEAGLPNIMRWNPFNMDETVLRNRLRNKMVRPTTIPHTLEDLYVEQSVCREALRLAFDHHKSLARGLKGVQQQRSIGDAMSQSNTGATLVNLMELDMIIGSGGVLSHAPLRAQAALMMIDAFQPEGVTMMAVDSIFMMPQLGVLATVTPEAATEVFHRDCLVKLGSCISPTGTCKEGDVMLTLQIDGRTITVKSGELQLIPLAEGEKRNVSIQPAKGIDAGAGKGKSLQTDVEGGVVGLMIDGRGRPLRLPVSSEDRVAKQRVWLQAMGLPLPV